MFEAKPSRWKWMPKWAATTGNSSPSLVATARAMFRCCASIGSDRPILRGFSTTASFTVTVLGMSNDPVLEPFRSLADLHIDYARELNEQQYAAATAPPGPALVIAGAGSGKTRTLVYRVAFLLEQGIPPERILLLTFTNKAAKEMMGRAAELIGQELPGLWGGTFHSIGNRILRRHAELLGYPQNFTILDREDARHLLADCREEVKPKAEGQAFPRANEFADIFSFAGNTGRPLRELLEGQYEVAEKLVPLVEEMQRLYTEHKRAANSIDFDDLL